MLGVESRADWIANGVLYFPLGLLGVRALIGSGNRLLPGVASITLAFFLAVAVEFSQIHFPSRTVSQNDLLAESLGSLLGAGAGYALGPWLSRWRHALLIHGASGLRLAGQAYVVAYLLYCFFPFDLLLSRQELSNKLLAGGWGWVFAPTDSSTVAWTRALMLWAIEVVLALPIGLSIGRTRGSVASARRRGLLIGGLMGLGIEVGQLFIATGVSQGASVISRALGVGLGAGLVLHGRERTFNALRNKINRHGSWLMLTYLPLLAFASGWGAHAWQGWEHAQQSWDTLRLLPFYYHYFTTEARALTSVSSVVLMYSPIALWGWARMAGAASVALFAALVALLIESGKLFLADIHPDPTNILLAACSASLLLKAMAVTERRLRPASGRNPLTEAETPAPPPNETSATRPPFSLLWLGLPLVPVAWLAATWPAYPWLVLGVIGVAAGVTWRQPAALLVILPAALPVFDLAPWSGRYYLDEFDLLCVTCLAIVFARSRPALLPPRPRLGQLAFAAFGACLAIGALVGWSGSLTLDLNSFTNYLSPFNGLRIAKGALWAWGFVLAYRSLVGRQPAHARLFHVGIATGLALTVLTVLWERVAMVSLFDFSTQYRVTGPFSVMNKGGAYIECFLAVAAAFIAVELATCRRRWVFIAASALLAFTCYAVLVTYSRNGYAALGAALLIALIAGWRQHARKIASLAPALIVAPLLIASAGMILGGSYATERLRQSGQDLALRLTHWQTALELRDESLSTTIFGVGLGRFPDVHFWQSRTEARAATFRLEQDQGNTFLRLAPGAKVYVEQIFLPPVGKTLALTINLRSPGSPPKLAVTVCRKTLLTSDECAEAEVLGIPAPGIWQTQYASIPPLPAPPGAMASLVPIKVSLHTPGEAPAIDIDNVSLRAEGEDRYLLHNGSFETGIDHWFFATDVDPPWHIHSLPVAVLFDLGWLGLAAATAMIFVAIHGGLKALRYRNIPGTAAFAAFAAFLVSGSLNTLIDEPRFLWLWLVLAWLSAWHRDPLPRTVTRPNNR